MVASRDTLKQIFLSTDLEVADTITRDKREGGGSTEVLPDGVWRKES